MNGYKMIGKLTNKEGNMGSASEGRPMGGDVRALIAGAMVKAEAAVEQDNKLWEALEMGQDSEDAENSGVLVGYAEAFRAVHDLLTYDDTSKITGIIEVLKEEASTAKDKREMFLDAREPEDEPEMVTLVAFGANEALLAALGTIEALWNEKKEA